MVQFLNYGITSNLLGFFEIGNVLLSAYGYSAILVPIFLFVSAIFLLSVNFSKKKAVILAASLLPFYTVVATERICNKILPGSTEPVFILKISAAICICGLLIAIEYLAINIAYDAILSIKKSGKKKEKISTISTSPSDLEKTYVNEVEPKKEVFTDEESCNETQEKTVEEEIVESSQVITEEETLQEIEPEITVEKEEVTIEEVSEVVQKEVTTDEKEEIEEEPIVITFKNSEENLESEPEEVVQEESSSNLMEDLYQPNEDEENFLSDPFGENDTESEVDFDEKIDEPEINDESQEDEDIIKYDYNLEPEVSSEFMSEEERMNATVPLMNIQLGEELESDEEPENSDEDDEVIEEENFNFDENIEDNFFETSEENSLLPKDPLFQSAHSDFLIEEESVQENQFEENESEENDFDEVDFEEVEGDEYDEEQDEEDDDIVQQDIETKVQAPVVQSVPKRQRNTPYRVPSEGLLTSYPDGEYWIIDSDTQKAAAVLKETLSEFKIEAEVTGIRKGPVITMFEILPAPGVKLNKIVALQDNIALRLAASSVRIVAPIPGKSAVGIEVPNKERAIVSFKELIETETAAYKKMAIPVVLGKDITGEAQLLDLAKTPHLLIAGSTGSGKSVCVNSMILSILYKRSPNEVKLILIDPKVVELKLYNDIPHLLTPVITEPKKAFQALQYCLCEMERRYALLDGMGVRDITSYNHRIVERNIATEKLPYIVVVIDEFADLMATTGKELESVVARLAAMSRAVGIHLVLATQRPSIDVITGLIKANIPTRIAFMVASKMDSRIIIDQVGAEKLLGRGDMLYASATVPFPVRIQGTFVSDSEVENVVDYVKQYGEPEYIDDEIFVEDDDDVDVGPNLFGDGEDPLYNKALEIVIQAGKASASYIQRRLKIGYNRAARLVEDMEARGIVGPANGSKPREIIHIP
ncbi:MAG: DNA translocase FtsK [Spirochaetaceae bacterium]|nr:DNA translocase FtsK [Spirochaetaceae bacterium]